MSKTVSVIFEQHRGKIPNAELPPELPPECQYAAPPANSRPRARALRPIVGTALKTSCLAPITAAVGLGPARGWAARDTTPGSLGAPSRQTPENKETRVTKNRLRAICRRPPKAWGRGGRTGSTTGPSNRLARRHCPTCGGGDCGGCCCGVRRRQRQRR